MDYAALANLHLFVPVVSFIWFLAICLIGYAVEHRSQYKSIGFGFKLAGTLLMTLWLIAFVFVQIFL